MGIDKPHLGRETDTRETSIRQHTSAYVSIRQLIYLGRETDTRVTSVPHSRARAFALREWSSLAAARGTHPVFTPSYLCTSGLKLLVYEALSC